MSVFNKVRLILYRCHEKGLEVLLIDPNLDSDPSVWKRLPEGTMDSRLIEEGIELGDNANKTIAIEADWHNIPSIRGIIKHDIERLKSKVKNTISPKLDDCNYVAVKDALKEVLPEEYAALKELKDIITDRNLSLSI